MKKLDVKDVKQKTFKIGEEFKKFISKGNVIDMAVGVIMGSAFGAIVNAVVNVFLSVCTWGVPGGLKGLVTVLPALGQNQVCPLGKEMNIITAEQYLDLGSAAEQALYNQHGSRYYYKGLAIVDWGTLINAVISFLIIALVLFLIIKIFTFLKNKRLEALKKLKHEEEKVETPTPVKSPELIVLEEIRDSLKEDNKKKTSK